MSILELRNKIKEIVEAKDIQIADKGNKIEIIIYLDDISKKETLEAIIKLNKLLDDEDIESYFKSENENIIIAEIDSKYFTENKITESKEINESGYNYKGYIIIDNPQENLWCIKGQNRNFDTDKDAEDFIDGLEELEEGLKHKNNTKIKN